MQMDNVFLEKGYCVILQTEKLSLRDFSINNIYHFITDSTKISF